ncbi:MAG: response regulator [Blastocatellia bacterium]
MANKILLADDSITIQKVVNLTFTDEGINVVTVGNGELALRKLSEDVFDLVLADIFMPGRNGYEVCEYVKTNPQHADIPVVLLVGAFEPFDKSEAARVRADGHLTKPFESRILVETVKRLLAESAARKAAANPPAAPEPQPAYRGQVVGWDVPTTPVPRQDIDDEEPGPPPYDPYVSTAKLPPLPAAMTGHEPEPEAASSFSDQTMAIGSPIPTGALFSPPSFPADSAPVEHLEPFTLNAPEEMPIDSPSAIKGPPDSLPGFSFATTSGPLPSFEAPADEADAVVSRRELPHTDSPLDLSGAGVIDQHVHEPAVIEERRDPLLETFADVAESTASVSPSADPDLEENARPAGTPSLTVKPSEDVTSAWDPQAQPPKAFEPEPEPPPAGAWGTSSYDVGETPFALSDEVPTSSGTPFEMPVDLEPPFSMPAGISEEEARAPLSGETLKAGGRTKAFTPGVGSATQRFTAEELDQLSAADETPTFGDDDAIQALEPAPTDWTPEIEPPPDEHAVGVAEAYEVPVEAVEAASEASVERHEAAADVEPATAVATEMEAETAAIAKEGEAVAVAASVAEVTPVNGSGAEAAGVPQSVIDEVVRRAMERFDDDFIREIAWEVVPDLAEKMILKRLGGE